MASGVRKAPGILVTTTTTFRFAVAATFTAEPLRRPITFWGRQLGVSFDVVFAPFNQIMQALLDTGSVFARNEHGVNLLLARAEDLAHFEDEDAGKQFESNLHQLLSELRNAPSRFPSPVLFCLCPPSPPFAGVSKKAVSAAAAALDDAPGVHFLGPGDIASWYPVDLPHSAEGERLGRVPYTEEYFAALATALVRYTHALITPPHKVIALDCDNTLWQGICGEDGPEGVVLDPPRRALHEFMLQQREAGMLLTLASKNNEEDVLETFRRHPEMPLKLTHFAGTRLNWDPKPDNLQALADALSLGLDSFIFVDDNPKECAEVQDAVPEVLSLALPEDTGDTAEFLSNIWAFDHPMITEEDRNRNAYYQQEQEFGNELKQAASLEQFMRSLNLRVEVSRLLPEKLSRAAQLSQRTNQFNFTTIRRSESEIQALEGFDVYTVDVSDRFGQYGLVGLLIVSTENGVMTVDTCLLSCRALGRGVEHRMFSWLGNTALKQNVYEVRLPFVETAKNKPARQFLQSIPFGVRSQTETGFTLQVSANELASLEWTPSAHSTAEPVRKPVARKPQHRRAVDYACIARNLRTASQVLDAIRAETRSVVSDSSMTETEQRLAVIWSEMLDRRTVAKTENFFDLGGHSLLAVLLLLRIKESFGVELSIDDVYSGALTLAGLASRIDSAQAGDIDPDEYEALLREIGGMSDEEARALLESEGAA